MISLLSIISKNLKNLPTDKYKNKNSSSVMVDARCNGEYRHIIASNNFPLGFGTTEQITSSYTAVTIEDEMLNTTKIVLICDSNDIPLLSIIYDVIHKRKPRLMSGIGLTWHTKELAACIRISFLHYCKHKSLTSTSWI